MIQKLSGLLHYMLYECKQPLVPLERELRMIENYISLERIRYGERLKIKMELQQGNGRQMIAPLLMIPFVENSFKHGTSKMLSNPEISLSILVKKSILYFNVTNSRPPEIEETSSRGYRGLGLKNVTKRLGLLYPGKHDLEIIDDPHTYSVWLKIFLSEPVSSHITESIREKIPDYELA